MFSLLVYLWLLLPRVAEGDGSVITEEGRGVGPVGVPAASVAVQNADMECAGGYAAQTGVDGMVPTGWTAAILNGQPRLNSTRIEFAGGCDRDAFIERISGVDSLVFLSQDIEWSSAPGKPFDAAIYQQVTVTPGVAYSLSAWMVSLCGGSNTPSDCPTGYYIAKMLGMDSTGGTDPLAPTVTWVEDERNFVESRWANLTLVTTAVSDTMTIFARIRSPFQWHGAHAFVDAITLVQAPVAEFVGLPSATVRPITGLRAVIGWAGAEGPDIPAIPAGTYELLFDLQYRHTATGTWTDWLVGRQAGSAGFTIDACTRQPVYDFRVRARAEQPPQSHGAFPDHHFVGAWSEAITIGFNVGILCPPRAYLPLAR